MSLEGAGGFTQLVSRVRAVEVPCVLNIAAVKLRFKEYDEAIHECNKVLGIGVRHSLQELTETSSQHTAFPMSHCLIVKKNLLGKELSHYAQ